MTTNTLTADNTNIVGIQLNLFDFNQNPKDFDMLLNQKITGHIDLNLENDVILTSPNHFEFDTRRCPQCGKDSLIKKKFVPRKTIIDKIGDVVLYLREYFCKKCHRYPKVQIKKCFRKIQESFNRI